MPFDTDWAWLAGILDGEGSINAYFRERKPGRRGSFHGTFVQIVNTDLELMEKAKAICDVKNKLTAVVRVPPRKTLYHLCIGGREDCRRILTATLPYLTSKKRRRAVLMLEYLESRGKWGKAQGHQLTEAEIGLLHRIQEVR